MNLLKNIYWWLEGWKETLYIMWLYRKDPEPFDVVAWMQEEGDEL